MYNPPAFKEDDPEVLHGLMQASPLATLVTHGPDGLAASHLPMLHLPERNQLLAHFSRANDHWRRIGESEGLAIFQGRQAYVTPAWYPSKQEHGKVVPTWNYEAVHVRGRLTLIEGKEDLLALVARLTQWRESGRSAPWQVSDAPDAFIAAQLKGIVGLRMEITRIEGKRKLSQNRPAADRQGVVDGLRQEGTAETTAVAAAMEALERN